jgi:hypothetical protein
MTNFNIRQATPDDISFIYSTWLNSQKYDNPSFAQVSKSIFFTNYQLILDDILLRSNTLIACHPDEPTVIFAYLVTEFNTIHYAFTKESFRKLNIQRSLLEHSKINVLEASHFTRQAKPIMESHNIKYNPFTLYKGTNYES